MHKMKVIFKKIFKLVFGIENNLTFTLSSSFFITAIIFSLLTFLSQDNSNVMSVFTIISALFFDLWIIIIQGFDSVYKFSCSLLRLLAFFIILIFSFRNCMYFMQDYNSTNLIKVIFSSMGLLLCSIYFVSKLINIFDFIKKIFTHIKAKLFNTTNPATSKAKALIENITAFLVAIGGLTVAIKVITESIFQVMDYFK